METWINKQNDLYMVLYIINRRDKNNVQVVSQKLQMWLVLSLLPPK